MENQEKQELGWVSVLPIPVFHHHEFMYAGIRDRYVGMGVVD